MELWKTLKKIIIVKITTVNSIDMDSMHCGIIRIHIKRKEIKWTKLIFRGERDLPKLISIY